MHRFAAIRSIIQSSLVHIHANEFVGKLRIEIAGELHGIGERFLSMVESILDAVTKSSCDICHQLRTEAAADRISSQRQRQPGDLLPPPAQIDNALQTGFRVTQLAFVNDKPGFLLAFEHLRNDLVERHNLGFYVGSEELQ